MFALGETIIYSATDLVTALKCEFAVLRRVDEVLGQAEKLRVPNAMRERAGALGQEHEAQILAEYRAQFGDAIIEVASVPEWTEEALQAQRTSTVAALAAGAPVVAQAGFFDGRFHGRADFLVREDAPDGTPRYTVVDAKVARTARPSAILQTAAYADQVLRAGIPISPLTHLHLGTGEVTSHEVHDAVAVLREHRAHVQALIDAHAATGERAPWGDDAVTACMYCDYCRAELEPARDVRLVWGLRGSHRKALHAAGLTTIEELAASSGPVPKIKPASLERFRVQAHMQIEQERREAAGLSDVVSARVHTVEALDLLPAPDPGDVFFDFEGDPMWVDDDRSQWGLEYLFGLREAPLTPGEAGRYVTFWAHDRAQEKQALLDFLAYLADRRAEHPGMHVYHYAFYEPAALRTLAKRHGVGQAEVEAILEAGVFVDLYETVKHGMHVSQRSYSIKKLEPLYMGAHLRDAEGVTDGGASVVAYAQACEMRDCGDESGWQARLRELAEYNAYDCESTLRLRDWLLEQRAAAHAEALATVVADAAAALGGSQVVAATVEEAASTGGLAEGLAIVGESGPATAWVRDEEVLADRLHASASLASDPATPLVAAALAYHRTEDEPFWRAHYDRLSGFTTDCSDTRDVLVVHHVRAGAWEVSERGNARRLLQIEGRLGTGSTLDAGSEVFCVYDPPLPFGMTPRAGAYRATTYGHIVGRGISASGEDVLEIRERLPAGVDEHHMLPTLVTPGQPPSTATLAGAIADVARGLLGDGPSLDTVFGGAALDVLRRTPPRQRDGGQGGGGRTDGGVLTESVLGAVLDSADSYVAVQGPPGTGKTTLGAHVIAALVREHGWRVGVVAQSHAVVEHMLARVQEAGVPAGQIGKRGKRQEDASWRALDGAVIADFLASADQGAVLGGTAWDFCNATRVPRNSLDLLVIDEAGQFSLANTLAVSTSTRRLLLIGDPQQLPQVSQGRHEQPIDASALSWLMDGDEVLPAERGYFLPLTWRLHPDLCQAVSNLSYGGQLASAPVAARRRLTGIDAGVHLVQVPHRGNVTESPEESAEVRAQVEQLLGKDWTDDGLTRPLEPSDVIVVAAYNAQVQRLRRDLERAGLGEVRVGTVDKFQGQEAAVVIVSLAASTANDAPRGLRFLLSRNRINVAISRGKWAAIIVRSPALTRHMPGDEHELAELGAFIDLCTHAHDRRQRHRH